MTSAPETSLHPLSRPAGEFLRVMSDLPDRMIAVIAHFSLTPGLLLTVAALAVMLVFWRSARRRVKTRSSLNVAVSKPCDWYVGSMRMASGAQKWHCQTCGRDGFSATREPPKGCNWSETGGTDAASA